MKKFPGIKKKKVELSNQQQNNQEMKSLRNAGKILEGLDSDNREKVSKSSMQSAKIMTEIKTTKRGPFKLKLGNLSAFPFVQHSFSIQLFLLDNFQQLVCGHEVPINCTLTYENNQTALISGNIFVFETEGPIVIGRNGMTTINVRFIEPSMSHANKRFMFHFTSEYTPTFTRSALSEPDIEFLSTIAPLSSHGMLVIRHRLLVKLDLRDNGNDDRQDIWFKDEGGKDNCIDLHVQLVDADNKLVITRSVPLRLTLQYASGEAVLKQDLLVVMPDSNMCVEKSGCALIKLRINDVSKNHQRQQFHITVSPDTGAAPLLNDVSADESHNIEVKSKRTKRTRDSISGGVIPTGAGTGGAGQFSAPTGAQHASTNSTTNNRNHQQQYSAPVSQQGGRGHSTASQQTHQHNQAALHDDSQLLLLGSVQSHGTRSSGNTALSTGVSSKNNGSSSSTDINSHLMVPSSSSSSTALKVDHSSPLSIVDALVAWTSSLTHRLQSVRWQQIGFEQSADGNVDPTRPLYSIRNPNDCIDEILKEVGVGSAVNGSLASLAALCEEFQRGAHNMNSSNGSKRQRTNTAGSGATQFNGISSSEDGFYHSGNGSGNGNGGSHMTSDSSKYGELSLSTDLIIENDYYGGGTKVRSNSNASEHEWASLIQNVEQANASLELRVHYIIALPYKTSRSGINSNSNNSSSSSSSGGVDNVELGFPAYSADENLLGFYQEKQDDRNHATVITFIPLALSVVELSTSEQEAADHLLRSQLSINSAAVYSMVKCGGDLESMKQDAMVHYWLSEVSLDDDDLL